MVGNGVVVVVVVVVDMKVQPRLGCSLLSEDGWAGEEDEWEEEGRRKATVLWELRFCEVFCDQ